MAAEAAKEATDAVANAGKSALKTVSGLAKGTFNLATSKWVLVPAIAIATGCVIADPITVQQALTTAVSGDLSITTPFKVAAAPFHGAPELWNSIGTKMAGLQTAQAGTTLPSAGVAATAPAALPTLAPSTTSLGTTVVPSVLAI